MHTLPVKEWFSQVHMPNAHDMCVNMGHMVRDDRFWAVVALGVLALLLMIVAFFTEPTGGLTTPTMPIYFP